jgi:hypothetical protein
MKGQTRAEAALRAYLAYTNVPDVLEHSLSKDRIAQSVATYYATHPIAATPFTEIVLDSGAEVAQTKTKAFLFRIRNTDRPNGYPVCMEETNTGYKVEWTAFTQCRDRAAANFWKNPSENPASLYIILKRSHYFGEDVGNIDDMDCYRINSPNPDEEPVYAFSRKDSAFSRKFRNQIVWDANYFAVAAFTHVKTDKGTTRLEITDIERFNWRSSEK